MAAVRFYIMLMLSLFCASLFSQKTQLSQLYNNPQAIKWVDSILTTLSLEEKVAQTMIIRSSSEGSNKEYQEIERIIKKYNVGGICFFKGKVEKQAELTNKWQKITKTPLLISIDAEWGLEMRLKDSTMYFPKQMTLGAVKNDSLVYYTASCIAQQLKRLGINMSFSPVADINNNPKNPVINYRSFGEDKENVTTKAVFFMKGLQDNGIIAVAKHFPGHGDTELDSHNTLPVIGHSRERLDSLELYPFKTLINSDIIGVMNAHIYVPALETETNTPASMSKNIVSCLLKDSLAFNGLAITDGLEMGAVTKYKEAGFLEVQSIIAGNDINLLPVNVEKAINSILSAISNGLITETQVNSSCKKILFAKYFAGLHKYNNINELNLISNLNTDIAKAIRKKTYSASITSIKNNNNLLPLNLNSNLKTACVIVSSLNTEDFNKMFLHYHQSDFYQLNPKDNAVKCNIVLEKLYNYDRIIVLVASFSSSIVNNFNMSDEVISFINSCSNINNSVLCLAINPYFATKIDKKNNYDAIVFAYEPVEEVFEILPQALFGAIEINGQLPVSIDSAYKSLYSVYIPANNVIAYPSDYEINIEYNSMAKVDSVAQLGIEKRAYPGCQIFVIHKGKVIYNKSFGRFTYDKSSNIVTGNTLYDVASITKIAATTLSIMKLQSEKMFDIDLPLSNYLPFLKNTDKKSICSREIMAHQAGFQSYIPFYKSIEQNNSLVSNSKDGEFAIKVSDKIYLKKDYENYILDSIGNSKLSATNKYVYSDLGFILLGKAVEAITGKKLSEYAQENFYSPLGLTRTLFNPISVISQKEIAPTEDDKTFRQELVWGYVHDQTSAMLGGVTGHAGLFSTAEELGKIMYMLLQKGNYGREKIIPSYVLDDFTAVQYPENNNRRALGFDKPLLQYDKSGPACKSASINSFGHSGFTGTYAWVDPAEDLVYVFMSNRIYPSAENTTMSKLNIRTVINQLFYDIINTKNQ